MKIRKNDEVMVIRGDDRGKRGKVLTSIPNNKYILVEGVNIHKRHTKARPNIKQAGIIDKVLPVHVSNVLLICSKCKEPTRVGFRVLDDKSKVRICKRCGEVMD